MRKKEDRYVYILEDPRRGSKELASRLKAGAHKTGKLMKPKETKVQRRGKA